jgi:hypothetical protein
VTLGNVESTGLEFATHSGCPVTIEIFIER